MINAAFHLEAVPEPCRILGLRLKPLSLGHYILMQKFQCAFVADTPTAATLDDLLLGVLICSMSYAEFLEFLDQEDFNAEILEWGRRAGAFDLNEKSRRFLDYIKAGSALPPYWEESPGTAGGGHWSLALKVALTSELGYTHDEALNLPLVEGFLDYFKLAENRGLVRLMTPDEVATLNALEKEAA